MNSFFSKRLFQAFFVFIAFGNSVSSQTLFTYGKTKVSTNEFLNSFKTSNEYKTASSYNTALKEYLTLYINTKLKTQQAYDLHYDTLQNILSDLEVLKKQVSIPFYTDSVTIKKLIDEAIYRSGHDVHLAHIFLAHAGNVADSVTVEKNLKALQAAIKNGEDFSTLAKKYSNDPSAQINGGDVNYITCFSLPYAFETIAYTTPVGSVSPMYTSPKGYHFFKVLGLRDNPGKVSLYQILLANPPGSSEQDKQLLWQRADSIYKALKQGANFSNLVSQYSVDYVSANNKGLLLPISIGEYDKTFEEKALALQHDGDLSTPFETSHGIHILKREGLKKFDEKDPIQMNNLITRLKKDSRWDLTYNFIYKQFEKKGLLKKQPYDDRILWLLSDSLVYGRLAKVGDTLTPKSVLYKINDTEYTVDGWIPFVRADRFNKNIYGSQLYPSEMEEYKKNIMQRYYEQHMELVNDTFATKYKSLKDNILFFEIQKNMVWDKAQENPFLIEQFYNTHKAEYKWDKSADVVIFTTDQQSVAMEFLQKLKLSPADWEQIIQSYSSILYEQSRVNWKNIPGLGNKQPVVGDITPVNKTDNNSFSFALIRTVYPTPQAMSMDEARLQVINDYQNEIDKQWVSALRKKYPVLINQPELNKLLAAKKQAP